MIISKVRIHTVALFVYDVKIIGNNYKNCLIYSTVHSLIVPYEVVKYGIYLR